MMGLPDGPKSFRIGLVVLIQYRLWQTPSQSPSHPASHVAVAITLIALAKASSLKTARRRKHCALAVVRRSQTFRPAADPLLGGAGRPKFNQLEIGLHTNPVWRRSMHAISSYRGNRHTNTQTYKHTPPARCKHTDSTDYNALRRLA